LRSLFRTFRPSDYGNQNSLMICRRSGMQHLTGSLYIFSKLSHPRVRQFNDGGAD
ncbi:hypothetical protein GE21DRAFT_1174497, partial [Neurospora crassa]